MKSLENRNLFENPFFDRFNFKRPTPLRSLSMSKAGPADRAFVDATKLSIIGGSLRTGIKILLWLIKLPRKSADFKTMSDHMLKDIGISRFDASWLETRD